MTADPNIQRPKPEPFTERELEEVRRLARDLENWPTFGMQVRDNMLRLLATLDAARREERLASFHLFNDAVNEFVENMKVDPEAARATMKRRMLDAVAQSGEPE